ncbi:MAG: DNA polymerase III subunit delta [Woeseiaceae bacterium]|nr:DNA polymerase III subunit delta [Woeseiaceae bacterium]
MKLQANQLAAHLKNNLASCYLVSGDEPLLVDEALDGIRAAARERGFTARELHVATTGFDWSQLAAAGSNLSLFAERRIVELRLPTGKPGRAGGQAIVDFTAALSPDLMLVVVTPKLDRSSAASKWAKTLDTAGASVPVWPVGVRELPGWVADRMRRVGLKPSREAVAMISDRVEGNLLAAQQEIEKLRLLLGEGEVSAEDVSNAVADSSRYDVYKLADAALAGDAKRALRILDGLREEGVEPVIVVWSLTRELRTLARIADMLGARVDLGTAMQQSGVWRNRQGLVRSAIGRQSRAQILKLLKACGRADATAKGQAPGDPWEKIAEIVLGLSLRPRKAA